MRVLVFPASLRLGGSQLNAIELAAAVAARGHEVRVFGPPGPLVETVHALGLPFTPAPERPKVRPSPHILRELTRAVRRYEIDVVHGYEWPPILEAVYGPYTLAGVAVVGTVMSMGVAPFIPPHVGVAVGTQQIADHERRRRRDVWLIEPPVDTAANRPWSDVRTARAQLGVQSDEFLVVVVSRLADELKRQGILEAINAAPKLAAELPLRVVIVGDGPARAVLAAAAEEANRAAGRLIVTLTGELADPRPAYAAADVCFGMGSSALRAMAFGKPLVVQGELGFWKTLTEQSLAMFLHQGWYGVGDGEDGSTAFAQGIRALYRNADLRARLGRLGRRIVEERFSLTAAAATQERIYRSVLDNMPSRRTALPGCLRPAAAVTAYTVRRRWQHSRGRGSTDDFNALARQAPVEGTRA